MKKKIIQLSIISLTILLITIIMIIFKAPIEVIVVMLFLTAVVSMTIPAVIYEDKHKNSYTEIKLKSFEEYMGTTTYTPIIKTDSSMASKLKLKDPFKSGMFNNLLNGSYKGYDTTIGQYSIQFDLGKGLSALEYYTGFYIEIKTKMNTEFSQVINSHSNLFELEINDAAVWKIKEFVEELGTTDETHLTSNLMMVINDNSLEVFIDGFIPFSMIEKQRKYKPLIKDIFLEVDRAIDILEKINKT